MKILDSSEKMLGWGWFANNIWCFGKMGFTQNCIYGD
jgi:hypothetical protein